MPALGMAQDTGKLVRWLKREGDQVVKGEPLMEVETDKATVEVESPGTGTLSAITAAEGDDVAVGHPIALLLAPGESPPAHVDSPPRRAGRSARSAGWGETSSDSPPRTRGGGPQGRWGETSSSSPVVSARGVASPKARRLADERGLDISSVVGSGPDGAVVEEDVLQALGTAAAPAEPALWRAMAENVTRSWRDAPHFFVMREVDASNLVAERARGHVEATYTDLIVHAVAAALTRHPRMNGSASEINIGLAVAVPDGLLVPVIHGADQLRLNELVARRKELLDRIRLGKLRAADLSGGTFTLSNLGMYGVDAFTAILTDGQAGILAVGRITNRVVAVQDAPAVRPTMMLSLSCDHRRVDGARAAEFMQSLVALLEKPQTTERC
jgi:pyruvate dehydrogenase E2 component (dihydrolipoamide acetyltransferase)